MLGWTYQVATRRDGVSRVSSTKSIGPGTSHFSLGLSQKRAPGPPSLPLPLSGP